MKQAQASAEAVAELIEWFTALEAAGSNVPAWRHVIEEYSPLAEDTYEPHKTHLDPKPGILVAGMATRSDSSHLLRLPHVVARYFTLYLGIARYESGPGAVGPGQIQPTQATPLQQKFLCDVAHAFHNITGPGGSDYFFKAAKQINAAWVSHEKTLLNDDPNHWIAALWPLPEST